MSQQRLDGRADGRTDGRTICSVPCRFRVNPSSVAQTSDTDFVQNSALQGQCAPLLLVKTPYVVGDNQLHCCSQCINKQPLLLLLLHVPWFNLTGGLLSTRVDPDLSNTHLPSASLSFQPSPNATLQTQAPFLPI